MGSISSNVQNDLEGSLIIYKGMRLEFILWDQRLLKGFILRNILRD